MLFENYSTPTEYSNDTFIFDDEYEEDFDDDESDEVLDEFDDDAETYKEAFADELDDDFYDDLEDEDGCGPCVGFDADELDSEELFESGDDFED